MCVCVCVCTYMREVFVVYLNVHEDATIFTGYNI